MDHLHLFAPIRFYLSLFMSIPSQNDFEPCSKPSSHTTMNDIPRELCASIFSYLQPNDLFQVGTISRAFHYEANRLLYRTIDLSDASDQQLLSWANAVAQNPSLGNLVRTLWFQSSILIRHDSLADDQMKHEALKKALGAVVNLQTLKITRRHKGQYHPFLFTMRHYAIQELFETSKFRLRSFRIDGLENFNSPLELFSFLSKQPEIEDWSQTTDPLRIVSDEWNTAGNTFKSAFLPHLHTFETNCRFPIDLPLLRFVTSEAQSLVRLSIKMSAGDESRDRDPFEQIMEYVHPCRQTLMHFHYGTWVNDKFIALSLADQIGCIAQVLPGLQSLSCTRDPNWITVRTDDLISMPSTQLQTFYISQESYIMIDDLARAISKFSSLENFRMESWSGDLDKQSLKQGLIVASRLFRCCSSLQRVCFYSHESADATRQAASYRRLGDGQAAFDGHLGFSSWREWQGLD